MLTRFNSELKTIKDITDDGMLDVMDETDYETGELLDNKKDVIYFEDSDDEEDEKGDEEDTKQQSCNLVFPVKKIHENLEKSTGMKVENTASVYLSAVLEYLTAELVELSGIIVKENNDEKRNNKSFDDKLTIKDEEYNNKHNITDNPRKDTIKSQDIKNAFDNDKELSLLDNNGVLKSDLYLGKGDIDV